MSNLDPPDAPLPGSDSPPRTGRKLGRVLLARLKRAAITPVDYLHQFNLKKHLALVRFGVRIWQLGWAMRLAFLGFLLLAAGLAGTGWFEDPAQQRVWREWLLLGVFAYAFSMGVAVIARWPVWAYALLVPWFAYLGMLAVPELKPNGLGILAALPVWALLGTAWWVCRAEKRRWRGISCWVVLAMGAGWLTSGVSGFRAVLGLNWQMGGALLGILLATAGGAAWWRNRSASVSPPQFGPVLAGMGGVMALVIGASGLLNRAHTSDWISSSLQMIDFLATLFWFWAGGNFAAGLWRLTGWGMRRAVRLGLGRPLLWVGPVLWIVVTAGERFAAREASGRMLAARESGGQVTGDDLALWMASQGHVVVTGAVLVMLAALKLSGRLTAFRLVRLNALWVLLFLVCSAVTAKFAGFQEPAGPASLAGWAAAVLILGLMVDIAQVEKNWGERSANQVGMYLAWIAAILAIAVAGRLFPGWRIENLAQLQIFAGMITLGLPRAVYRGLTHPGHRAAQISGLAQVALIVAGSVAAHGIMRLNFAEVRMLLLAVPLFAALLSLLRHWRQEWGAGAGAMAGAMLAAGLTCYWRMPSSFCLPFQPAIPDLETFLKWMEARRSLGLVEHLGLSLGGVAAGALLGGLIFRQKWRFPALPNPWGKAHALDGGQAS